MRNSNVDSHWLSRVPRMIVPTQQCFLISWFLFITGSSHDGSYLLVPQTMVLFSNASSNDGSYLSLVRHIIVPI